MGDIGLKVKSVEMLIIGFVVIHKASYHSCHSRKVIHNYIDLIVSNYVA